MLTNDLPAFEETIKRLEKIFGKELDDETMQAYWGALKDQSLATFNRLAEHHVRNGKFFPKPFELRPKEDRGLVRDATADGAFQQAEARCIANLEELRRQNPTKWAAEVRLRKLDRVIATEPQHTPTYARALCEWREARNIHVGDKEWAEVGGR
jgi:hypothetical protein